MKIAVLGVGCTKFGELWDKSLLDLLGQSQLLALNDSNILPSQIDAIFTGNMCADSLVGQQNLGVAASNLLNLSVPSVRVEAACASGAAALSAGINALMSGQAEVVLVNGVEKMTDASIADITKSLMTAAAGELEAFVGATFPALSALIARAYICEFGVERKHLAAISVKNHFNGSLNPIAHIQKKIDLKTVLNAPMVADPLSLLDCSPMSDGAASIVLATENFAKKHFGKKSKFHPVFITASASATDTLALADRESLIECKATRLAAQKAFKQANITHKNVDVLEVHDAFTVAEMIALEDLGFCKKGQAKNLDGSLNVNPSGGLKSRGHPVGATGIAQVVEIVQQLQGRCGERQVKHAKIGLCHNMGGIGSNVFVHILRQID